MIAPLLFAFSMSLNLYAQEITTTGTVVDQNGEPLIGVTVSVMKGNNGTITDIDGNYKIDVPNSKSILAIRMQHR